MISWKDLGALFVFLIIFVGFIIFVSSRHFIVLQFKVINFFEKWRIQRLKNKERRASERFKSDTKSYTADCAEKMIKELNYLMDKNEMFLSLGHDRYFDLELTPEENESFSLILFRPYTVDSLDIDALPEIKRIIESKIRIDFNDKAVYCCLGENNTERLINGWNLEDSIRVTIIKSREYIIKSYRLTRINQLV